MTRVQATRLPDLDAESVRDGVADIARPVVDAVGDARRVVLVPDVHYPYHPSTGMVTNPDVVAALRDHLTTRLPGTTVEVGLTSDAVGADRVADYLGYAGREGLGDDHLLNLDAARADEARADGERPVTLPSPLSEAAVVAVPSARVGGTLPLAGGYALVTRALGADPTDETHVRRALAVADPAGAVVDATYAFAGDPHRARTLLGSAVVGAADAVTADLLGVRSKRTTGLNTAVPPGPVSVRGADLRPVGAALPSGDLPASKEPHGAVRYGYRLYTRVSGDIFPPQLEGGG